MLIKKVSNIRTNEFYSISNRQDYLLMNEKIKAANKVYSAQHPERYYNTIHGTLPTCKKRFTKHEKE